MTKPRILHVFSPAERVSPFDVNMAADAGFEIIVPYPGVGIDDIAGLVQDAIFSRPPKMFSYSGAFIGGWDVNLAAEMLAKAKQAQVPPFELSLFADPNGAYTTAAALVALVGRKLGDNGYRDRRAMIFGGGPVGLCAAVLIAQQGGHATLVRLTPARADKQAAIAGFAERYGVTLDSADGETETGKRAALGEAEVVICSAKAGVQILTREQLGAAPRLRVAADVNAVPPTGIEGLKPGDNGAALDLGLDDAAVGVGALAIGSIKYQVQHRLFKHMLGTDRALALDLPDAYALAENLV